MIVRHDRVVALTRTKAHEETHHLRHVRLYRDELEQIIRSAAEIGEPAIEGPGFTATTEKDLADPAVPEKLDWLTITASQGEHQLRVSFSGTSAVAETTEPNTLLHGALSRVVIICQDNWRRGKPRMRGAGSWLSPNMARREYRTQKVGVALLSVFPVLLVAVTLVPYVVGADERPPCSMLVSVICIALLYLWMAWQLRRRSSAVLINAYRADRPTFWHRKRDDLMINVVMLALGAVLGAVVTKIMG